MSLRTVHFGWPVMLKKHLRDLIVVKTKKCQCVMNIHE
uniref:Uncharacterized protein n=1 Tax=Anguilla anguilla TaxID=7936 RepID=A0A0E9R2I8_ANGAN